MATLWRIAEREGSAPDGGGAAGRLSSVPVRQSLTALGKRRSRSERSHEDSEVVKSDSLIDV
jgi:hypothetical protein